MAARARCIGFWAAARLRLLLTARRAGWGGVQSPFSASSRSSVVHDQRLRGVRASQPTPICFGARMWLTQQTPAAMTCRRGSVSVQASCTQPSKEHRMATYQVGYFVGSLASNSINRLLAKALVRLAPPELKLTEIPIKDLPLYSSDYDADYPPLGARAQAGDRRCRCRALRDARVQPLDPRRAEERHRLGQPALGKELLRAQAPRVSSAPRQARSAPRWRSRACAACCASATRR